MSMRSSRVVAWAVLAVAPIAGMARSGETPLSPRRDAQGFVRAAVAKEIAANADTTPHWRYRLAKTNASGSRETEIIETPDGLVGRLMALNGQPLTPQVARDEAFRLQQLKQDSHRMQAKLSRQEHDRARVFRMVKAMPDALLFTYAGSQPGRFGEEVVFAFKPNPGYRPDSLETDVLHKMSGTLRVNIADRRLVRLQGSLDTDVGVGMGIVGKVRRGGTLLLDQARIAPGLWEVTALDLHVTGRALFKHLDLSVSERVRDFRAVPPDLSVSQAIDLLLRE